ncbi:MAG: AmpG family muropeptide MFS transporter [bacterium]|nr:AmpG family muropeptide MFS transporter [bacterium]
MAPKKILKKMHPYRDPRIMGIFFLGFSSGLPFLLLLSTLAIWLQKEGISKTTIGLFSWATLPYALKFLWAPFLDRWTLPVLGDLFGRRRGWLIGAQIGLAISICGLGFSDPGHHLTTTALWAGAVAFFAATQDIVYEAYRVELLKGPLAGYGVGASVMGYRVGLLVAGAGALYLEVHFGWSFAYAVMACCMVIGMVAALLSLEPPEEDDTPDEEEKTPFHSLVTMPLKALLTQENVIFIAVFLMAYKVGDTVLNVMSGPFLLEIGFSELEIAHVAKSFGITAMMVGGLVGGILLAHKSLRYALFLCAIAQVFASLMFVVQAGVGYSVSVLFVTMGIENFVCGLSQTALIAYLAHFCRRPFTATHYALLSSLGSLVRIVLSSMAGWAADQMAWTSFYGSVALGCLPCLILLWAFSKKFMSKHKTVSTPSLEEQLAQTPSRKRAA